MRALVTGASSGVGLATARALARAGAEVHGLARRVDPMRAAGLAAHRADVTSPEQVAVAVAEATAGGPLDVAVFAAGANVRARRLDQLTPATWDALVATNLSAAFYCLHAVLPAMRRPGGLAVFVASVSAAGPSRLLPNWSEARRHEEHEDARRDFGQLERSDRWRRPPDSFVRLRVLRGFVRQLT